jgi:hypothetical protein
MLLALKAYLMTHNIVRLEELARHFNEDPNVIQDMLEHFIRKGQVVKQIPSAAGCDDCAMKCSGGFEQFTTYEWKKPPVNSESTHE